MACGFVEFAPAERAVDPTAPPMPEAERLAKEQKKSNIKGAMQFFKVCCLMPKTSAVAARKVVVLVSCSDAQQEAEHYKAPYVLGLREEVVTRVANIPFRWICSVMHPHASACCQW